MSNCMKSYGFRAWPLYKWGSSRPARLIYTFLSSPFPECYTRAKGAASKKVKMAGAFSQSREPQGRTYQVEPLTFLGQLFKINYVVS